MIRATSVSATFATMFLSVSGQVSGAEPLYVAVDCIKSNSEGYGQSETRYWQPVHQHLVDEGKRESWALYKVAYGDRSRCNYYAVTTFRGVDQLNADPDYLRAYKAVHPDSYAPLAIEESLLRRDKVSTELWIILDQTEIRPHRFAIVNKMFADDAVAYESMESDVFKAGHQVLVDRGERAGWAVYSLVSPIGSAVPYNYGTVDFVEELGPVPMAEAMMEGNPDRDLDAMAKLLELREHVLSETWELVAATEVPAED